jgi:hypothetical protein
MKCKWRPPAAGQSWPEPCGWRPAIVKNARREQRENACTGERNEHDHHVQLVRGDQIHRYEQGRRLDAVVRARVVRHCFADVGIRAATGEFLAAENEQLTGVMNKLGLSKEASAPQTTR